MKTIIIMIIVCGFVILTLMGAVIKAKRVSPDHSRAGKESPVEQPSVKQSPGKIAATKVFNELRKEGNFDKLIDYCNTNFPSDLDRSDFDRNSRLVRGLLEKDIKNEYSQTDVEHIVLFTIRVAKIEITKNPTDYGFRSEAEMLLLFADHRYFQAKEKVSCAVKGTSGALRHSGIINLTPVEESEILSFLIG